MNKVRIFGIIDMAVVIVLELLPYGSVCIFMNGYGDSLRETYSYFNPLPIGYANWGPLITALLSCLLLVIWIYGAVFASEIYHFKGLFIITAIALLASASPLFLFGIGNFSLVGAAISLLLICALVLSALGIKLYSK